MAASVLLIALAAAGALDPRAFATPTPAPLLPRTVPRPGQANPGQETSGMPAPGASEEPKVVRTRVRLKQDVLVHTAPSEDAPRPAVSLLGAGIEARLIERQGDWVLIEYGPLFGWTAATSVEVIDR